MLHIIYCEVVEVFLLVFGVCVGAVRRLVDLCAVLIKAHMNSFDLSLIPLVLRNKISAEENNSAYKLFYYHELPRTTTN